MEPYAGPFGCGYPSDPSTVQWLKDNVEPVFGYPDIVRFSWSSCENILKARAAQVIWPEEGTDEDKPVTQLSTFANLKTIKL